jgi:Na+-translocating ferredoxin:NAD+ oxidoreductase RnfG subunit
MIRRYIGIIILALVTTTAVATFSYLPDYLTKKMNKHIAKTFGKSVQYEEIPVADAQAINHQIFKLSNADTLSGYSIITRALGCRIGGCEKPTNDTVSFEQFYFLTAFDKQKNIKCVRVLEYTSNHGYQIASKGWLRQFEEGDSFTVGKNIDGISGATISVKSITKGVNEQIDIINNNL